MRKSASDAGGFFSYSSFFYAQTDHITSPPLENSQTMSIPVESPASEEPNPKPIHVVLPNSVRSAAAVRIQSAYRSHAVRKLVRDITAIDSAAGRLEELIQRQETVDAVRSDDRERLRVNEGLMSLLLRLDGVRGINPAVRELRRSVSRRIVALQEVLDAVCAIQIAEVDGFPRSWEEIVGVYCSGDGASDGRGGGEKNWCDGGFECLERFLRRLNV